MSAGAAHPPRIAALDLVRLAAAAWVLAWHFFFDGYHVKHTIAVRTPALEGLAQYGFLGVQVFFVISGFVIALSCQGRGVREFAAARAIRLYPAYWICGALTLAVAAVWGQGAADCAAGCVALNATMLNGFFDVPYIDPSYWSLAVELEFYAFVAVLIAFRRTHRLFELMLAWLVLAALPFLKLNLPALGLLYRATVAMWAPFFACGVMLYLIRSDGPRPRYWLVLALAWVLAAFYISVDVASFFGPAYGGHHFSRKLGVGLFSAWLLLLAAIALGRVALPASRFTRLCGGASYPLYLLHQVVGITLIGRLRGRVPDGWLMSGVSLLVLVLAALVWACAERPLQRQLKAVLGRRGGLAVGGA